MSVENIRNRAISQNLQTNNVMKIRKVTPMKLTLAELKEVFDANANHPKAAALRTFYDEHSRFLPQETVVAVEKAVVLGILDGAKVIEKTVNVTSEGREIVQTEIEEG